MLFWVIVSILWSIDVGHGMSDLVQPINDVPWVGWLINNGLQNFTPQSRTPGELCSKHGVMYRESKKNWTLWAVQMIDASSGGTVGALVGNNYNFGDFDECISIDVPELNIKGKYVVATFELKRLECESNYPIHWVKFHGLPMRASAQQVLMNNDNRWMRPRNVIHWALCVPDSCGNEDVRNSLDASFKTSFEESGYIVNITIDEKFSYSGHEYESALAADSMLIIIFLGSTTILVTLVAAATARELIGNDFSPIEEIWIKRFSAVSNLRKLTEIRSNEFSSISGMKVISIMLIIIGHRLMIGIRYNRQYFEQMIGTLCFTYVTNGCIIVNTFFVITGFLTYYKVLRDIDSNGRINVLSLAYHRWTRLTPAYAYIMALSVIILPHISTGPLGRSVIWNSACREYWWTHVLYLNNYVATSKQCLLPSWYMAVDMQLYILCSVLGYVLWKSKKWGLVALYTVTFLSIIIPGITVAVNHYYGVYLLFFDSIDGLFSDEEFVETYIHTHNRAAAYLIGMFGGHVYHKLKSKKVTLSGNSKTIIYVTMGVLFKLAILGAWIFYIPGREYNVYENIAYAIYHKVGWALPICCVIIIHAIYGSRIFEYTLCCRVFQILNGLTYSVLLVHVPIQLYLAGYPSTYTFPLGIWMGLGDIAVSYVAALLLFLFVEGPFTILQELNLHIGKVAT